MKSTKDNKSKSEKDQKESADHSIQRTYISPLEAHPFYQQTVNHFSTIKEKEYPEQVFMKFPKVKYRGKHKQLQKLNEKRVLYFKLTKDKDQLSLYSLEISEEEKTQEETQTMLHTLSSMLNNKSKILNHPFVTEKKRIIITAVKMAMLQEQQPELFYFLSESDLAAYKSSLESQSTPSESQATANFPSEKEVVPENLDMILDFDPIILDDLTVFDTLMEEPIQNPRVQNEKNNSSFSTAVTSFNENTFDENAFVQAMLSNEDQLASSSETEKQSEQTNILKAISNSNIAENLSNYFQTISKEKQRQEQNGIDMRLFSVNNQIKRKEIPDESEPKQLKRKKIYEK